MTSAGGPSGCRGGSGATPDRSLAPRAARARSRRRAGWFRSRSGSTPSSSDSLARRMRALPGGMQDCAPPGREAAAVSDTRMESRFTPWRCDRSSLFIRSLQPLEAGLGVAEAVELHSHPIHDREVQTAHLPILVAGLQVV